MLTTTPSVITFSMPLYKPSVFSRTITRSTLSKRVFTPGMLRIGRTAAYRFNVRRSATFTELKPLPIGVVHGPLSATWCCRMAFSVVSGRVSPSFKSSAVWPAW